MYSDEDLKLKREIIAVRRQIEDYERAEEQKALEEERRIREIQTMKETCELGKRFQSRTFDTFDASTFERPFAICKRFAEKFPEVNGAGIYLFGTAGTGKTHLTAAIANYIIEEKRQQVIFVNHITLLNRIRESFKDQTDITGWYKKAPLLIMDDLGKSKVTDWASEVLYDIVNYRYEDELPTVFTSNHSISQLASMVGNPTASRISEMCYVMEMSGSDRRLK